MYRTGDWARVVIGADGKWSEIEYLGRMGGDQVKISGRRVELGEVRDCRYRSTLIAMN